MNKIEAIYGSNFREALEDILYRMETGRNRPMGGGRLMNSYMNWVNNSVGAIMFFNFRSATLQTISLFNFINWSDNNPVKFASAISFCTSMSGSDNFPIKQILGAFFIFIRLGKDLKLQIRCIKAGLGYETPYAGKTFKSWTPRTAIQSLQSLHSPVPVDALHSPLFTVYTTPLCAK